MNWSTIKMLSLLAFGLLSAQDYPKKHDYNFAAKRPFMIDGKIPNWEHFEGTLYSNDLIRLSTSVPGSRGSFWSTEANPYKDWEAIYSFQISGRDTHGREGLAFWYTEERGVLGPIMGNQDMWNGLAIFQDTYDDLYQSPHPFIAGILNDGNLSVANSSQVFEKMFGGCYQNFRNTPNPVFVKVTYKNNQLTLATDIDMGGKRYLPCFNANDIQLPTGYYFGFSASSTAPADDHDLLSFDLYDLNPPDYEKEESESVSTEDGEATAAELRKKMDEIKSHLDKMNNQGQQTGGSITNLDQVIQAQNKLTESINAINSKLDQIQNKLNTIGTSGSSSGSSIPNNANNIPNSYNNGNNQGGGNFNEITRTLSQVHDLVRTINDQVNSLKSSDNKEFDTVKNSITQLASNVGKILQNSHTDRVSFMGKVDSLVSRLTYLIVPLALCGILLSGYNYYKGKSPTAKKFL